MRRIALSTLLLALAVSATADEPKPSSADEFLKRWDANGDGAVTKDECESSRLFAKIDQDGDGKITRDEIEQNWKDGKRPPATDGGRDGKRAGGGGTAAGEQQQNPDANRRRIRRIFNRYDRDGDDSLSKEEGATYYFDVIDLDRDGALTQDELASNPRVGPEKAALAMQTWDKDADGTIMPGEWSLPEDGAFSRVDTNGDGRVSFDEALAGLPGAAGGGKTGPQGRRGPLNVDQVLKDNDTDGDGKVSSEEFKGPKQLFSRADANADGFLDRSELEAASKKLAKLVGDGGPQGGQGGGGARNLGQLIKRADANGDGKVSREEWPGRPQGFDRMDKNGDGYLDESDFGEDAPKPMDGGTDPGDEGKK